MRKIKIYILANEKELENDEKELSNFIRDLNDKYESQDVYFQLIADEDINYFNPQEIEQSDLFFILFYHEIKENTIRKFHLAYDNFMKCKSPKISTYFKKSTNGTTQTVLDFMKELDSELGHYYNVYENIDSIKLNLVLRLNSLGFHFGKLDIKDGTLYASQKEIMSLEHIPIVINNKELNQLKKESQELEEKYWSLKERCRLNANEQSISTELETVDKRRNQIKEQIHILEKNILELQSRFIQISNEGNLSKRQVYAQKCLEEGDIQSAKEALKLDDIKREAEQLLKLHEITKSELQIKVNELIQRAHTLILDVQNVKRFHEIDITYKEAIKIEKEAGLYQKSLLSYANDLLDRHEYENSIKFAKQFLNYVETIDNIEKNIDIYHVYVILGKAYSMLEQYLEGEKNFSFALKQAEENDNVDDVIEVCQAIITYIYEKTKEIDKAEFYYCKMIDLLKNNTKDDLELANIEDKLGDLYVTYEMYSKAVKYLEDANDIYQSSLKTIPSHEIKHKLFLNYHNLLTSYINQKEYVKFANNILITEQLIHELDKEQPRLYFHEKEYHTSCIAYYLSKLMLKGLLLPGKASQAFFTLVGIFQDTSDVYYYVASALFYSAAHHYDEGNMKLYKKCLKKGHRSLKFLETNIEKIEDPALKKKKQEYCLILYLDLANLYKDVGNAKNAEKYYHNALRLYDEINNPTIYNRYILYSIHWNIRDLLDKQKRYEEEEKVYQLEIDNLKSMLKEEPDNYLIEITTSYNNLGVLHDKMNKIKESQNDFQEKIKYCEKMSDDSALKDECFEITYNNLFMIYYKNCQYKKSLSNCEKALKYQERLLLDNPDKYEIKLSETYRYIGKNNWELHQYKQAIPALEKAIVIKEKIKVNEKESIANLSLHSAYLTMASCNYRLKKYKQAVTYYQKAIALLEKITQGDFKSAKSYELDYAYYNLGMTYEMMKQYSKMKENLFKAKKIRDISPSHSRKKQLEEMECIYRHLAIACRNLKEKEEANAYTEQADALLEESQKL